MYSLNNFNRIIVLFLFLLLFAQIHAQQTRNDDIIIGKRIVLTSEILNEDREIWIYTPTTYAHSESSYPVIYLLDGPAHFHHTTGIIDFLSRNNRMPQMLLVAIANTDRTRDLTPETQTDSTNRFPTSGGADFFLEFITKELAPYIEKNYRTDPYRILVGHSFGGLFAIHTLHSQPDLFNAYISISPALWWNDEEPIKQMQKLLTEGNISNTFLYITMGNEGGQMLTSFQRLEQVFLGKSPEKFDWTFELMDQETHGSIPHLTTYSAFEKLFSDWAITNIVELVDAQGIEGVDTHYEQLSKKFGYTINTPENIINQLGYLYLGRKEFLRAINLFKRNVKNYPKSANVYDSLGDGYDANNQPDLAFDNYKKAVELAQKSNHQNLPVYRANLERLKKKLDKI